MEPSQPAQPPPTPDRTGFWATVRASLSGEQFDYTSGKLGRAIVLLAVPMILELSMESLFAICDIFWVAQLGSEATAAVGLTEAVLTLYYAVAIGVSMAATATVARRIGEKRTRDAAAAGVHAIYIGLGVGGTTGFLCWTFAPEILELMGADAATVDAGAGYTRLILGLNTIVMLLFLNNAIFRGAGDATLAMKSLCIGNIINIVLDPLLIFGVGPFPALGLTGAAVATVCGRGTAVLYQLWILSGAKKQKSRIVLRGDVWRFDAAATLRMLRVSLGGIAQMAVATTSWVALMRLMAQFGPAALAGYTIGIRILVFTLLPSWGLSNAAATLVGQNLGAGKPERAERSVWLTGYYNMIFLSAVTVVFILSAPRLVMIFTDDPEVIPVAVASLRVISYGYPFYAWGMVFTQGFNGAGDTMTPTWINVGCFWMLQIPLAWILVDSIGSGANGVFWAVAISESILAVVAYFVFRRGRWKTRAV